MAKKGGKKKGGKGNRKKKGEKREDEMTLKEAMLAFQIQVKEKASEELQFEIRGLKEKNKRYQERNARLKEEQLIHIKTLLRQAKEQEHELEQREVYNSEHVEQALKEKWEAARVAEGQLDELRLKIEETDKEYTEVSAEVEYWSSYRDHGSDEHKTQIRLLNDELDDLQHNFDEMCAHLKRQLDAAKSEVKAHMDQCMAEQKHLASEKAMEHLDASSVQEVHENDWLKNEAEVHRAEEKNLRAALEVLERENLEIISNLLDCRQEDLKISRNFYLTQFTENEILDDSNMLDMDMKQMSVYQKGYDSPSCSTPQQKAIEDRPRSAMQKAVEDKVFSIMSIQEEEEEEEEEHNLEADMIAHQDEYINVYEDKEFLHLGPLEIKLLCVHGEKKQVHPMDARQQIVDGTKPDITVTRPRWPVQTPMIKAALDASSSQANVVTTVKVEQ
ncbi:coiled-coil domain-containing protein 83-like [Clavelina lepadiformis]|uniref:coiled-coil domain-containing protein 83-like n=1 Tax=Clavelina lepadiformis TaxID=159417 RepID=UPI0040427F6A